MMQVVKQARINNTSYLFKAIKPKAIAYFGNSIVGKSVADRVCFGSSARSIMQNSSLSQEQIDGIMSKIREIDIERASRPELVDGNGVTSWFYKLGKWGAKLHKDGAIDYAADPTYEKEALALIHAKKLGLQDSQEFVDIIKDGDKHYLISTFMDGVKPNKSTGVKITETHLEDLVKKLFVFDSNGFIHTDLQLENILLAKNEPKVQLIDFGGFSKLVPNVQMLHETDNKAFNWQLFPQMGKDSVKVDLIRNSHFIDINASETKPFAAFSKWKINDINKTSNPYFKICSNVSNFEFRGLYYYLLNVCEPDEAKQLFNKYLRVKSRDYHTPMANFLESLKINNIEEITKASDISSEEALETLNRAIKHERISARLLGSTDLSDELSEAVKKTELAGIQLRYLISERKGGNKDETRINLGKLKNEFNTFKEMVEGFVQNTSDPEAKIYFNNMRKLPDCFKWAEDGCVDVESVELPDDKNILKLMFKKAAEVIAPAVEEVPVIKSSEIPKPEEISEIINKSSSKKWVAIGAVVTAIIGFVMHLYTKHKKQKTSEFVTIHNINPSLSTNNKMVQTLSPAVPAVSPTLSTSKTNPFSNFNFNREEKSVFKDFLVKN